MRPGNKREPVERDIRGFGRRRSGRRKKGEGRGGEGWKTYSSNQPTPKKPPPQTKLDGLRRNEIGPEGHVRSVARSVLGGGSGANGVRSKGRERRGAPPCFAKDGSAAVKKDGGNWSRREAGLRGTICELVTASIPRFLPSFSAFLSFFPYMPSGVRVRGK